LYNGNNIFNSNIFRFRKRYRNIVFTLAVVRNSIRKASLQANNKSKLVNFIKNKLDLKINLRIIGEISGIYYL